MNFFIISSQFIISADHPEVIISSLLSFFVLFLLSSYFIPTRIWHTSDSTAGVTTPRDDRTQSTASSRKPDRSPESSSGRVGGSREGEKGKEGGREGQGREGKNQSQPRKKKGVLAYPRKVQRSHSISLHSLPPLKLKSLFFQKGRP